MKSNRVRKRPERLWTAGIAIDPVLHKRAVRRARELRRSFSAHVSSLLAADLERVEAA